MGDTASTQESVSSLMTSLRSTMAKEMSSSKRLNNILVLLCEYLHMPTVLLYAARPGDVLERYSMVGKNCDAPAFVRFGEGDLGKVALERKTELGHTKSYKTVLTVPIIKGNELISVLQLLSKKEVKISSEVIESVQNVAMVLAEFLTELTTAKNVKSLGILNASRVLDGTSMIRGFVLGEILIHKRLDASAPILTSNPQKEKKYFNLARTRLQAMIKRRLLRATIPTEEKDLFETYLLFLDDGDWQLKVETAIASGLTAQAALKKVADDMLDRMRSISDPYFKERARDFQDLTLRLMQLLVQKKRKKQLVGNKILVADSLGASELLDYDLKHIKGIVLEDGSQTTHVVIVARAYRIPLLGAVKDATKLLDEGAPAALDGISGKLYLRPSDEILDDLKNQQKLLLQIERTQLKNKDKPAKTKEGIHISLMLNLGLTMKMDQLPNCDGVGLYRTELLFMTEKALPNIKTQAEAYRHVLAQSKGLPVVFRTLDIGFDKALPYLSQQGEENPAMGWRSIRMTLDRRALLRNQLRALLRATAGNTLYVMFPMIANVMEFVEAKNTLDIEIKNAMLRREKLPKKIVVGTMLEVPSLIFQLDNLLSLVDFISVGTNDLSQFMFAADRSNVQIARRYDVLSPAFLKALDYVIKKCQDANVPCCICGEMASHPLEALTLIALGARKLSMSPEALNAVKTAICSLTLVDFEKYLNRQLNSSQPSLRESLFSYLRDHNVEMGIV